MPTRFGHRGQLPTVCTPSIELNLLALCWETSITAAYFQLYRPISCTCRLLIALDCCCANDKNAYRSISRSMQPNGSSNPKTITENGKASVREVKQFWIINSTLKRTGIQIMSDLCHIMSQYYDILPPGRRLRALTTKKAVCNVSKHVIIFDCS